MQACRKSRAVLGLGLLAAMFLGPLEALLSLLPVLPTLAFPAAAAAVTYANLEEWPRAESLAESFKVSLVRPPGEASNSGSKMLVNMSSMLLLEPEEEETLDKFDALFEKYSLFCNGRWLGAQVLQDSQDLMYLQHITYMKKPDVVIETGTYKGGLTYFFASLLDWIDREREAEGSRGGDSDGISSRSGRLGSTVLSVDRHHPDLVFSANWFCPVCADCIRPYETDLWQRKVRFVQGLADTEDVYAEMLDHLFDVGVLRFVDATGRVVPEEQVDLSPGNRPSSLRLTTDPEKTVLVNLDANHEFDGLIKELFFYAPLVSEHSYLIVQDTKLDKIWGTSGPSAAVEKFLSLLPQGEFVVEPELKFQAYSQHTYLRRAKVTIAHTYFLDSMHDALVAQRQAAEERAKSEE